MIKAYENAIRSLSPDASTVVIKPIEGMHGIAKINYHLRDKLRNKFNVINKKQKSSDIVVKMTLDPMDFVRGFSSDIYVFHDAISYKYLGPLKSKIAYFMQARYLKNARVIICISQYAKSELLHYHPKANVAKITVIHNKLQAATTPSRPYFMWIGSNKAHKRIDLIYEIAHSCPNYDFIAVTNDLKGCYDRKNLTHLTNVSDIVLNSLLSHSNGIICTSSEEGFFLPFAEALNLSITCYGLRTAVFDELYASNKHVIMRDDVEALVTAIKTNASELEHAP